MRQMMTKFQQRNGATQCKLLKGVGTGKVLRECPLCVADASEFLEELLEETKLLAAFPKPASEAEAACSSVTSRG